MSCQTADREAIVQNLVDAGCDQAFINKFLQVREQGRAEEQIRLLSCQRCRLLDAIHAEQKKLDCLDYLRCRLQKEKGSEMEKSLASL